MVVALVIMFVLWFIKPKLLRLESCQMSQNYWCLEVNIWLYGQDLPILRFPRALPSLLLLAAIWLAQLQCVAIMTHCGGGPLEIRRLRHGLSWGSSYTQIAFLSEGRSKRHEPANLWLFFCSFFSASPEGNECNSRSRSSSQNSCLPLPLVEWPLLPLFPGGQCSCSDRLKAGG